MFGHEELYDWPVWVQGYKLWAFMLLLLLLATAEKTKDNYNNFSHAILSSERETFDMFPSGICIRGAERPIIYKMDPFLSKKGKM